MSDEDAGTLPDRRRYPPDGVPAHLTGNPGLRSTPLLVLAVLVVDLIDRLGQGWLERAC